MVIKRFGEPEKRPEDEPISAVDGGGGMFTPFKPVEDKRKAALGERVYSAGEDAQAALAEAEAEITALLGSVDKIMPVIGELVTLYTRAGSMPTPTTLNSLTRKVKEVAASDDVAQVLMALVSMLAYLQGKK